MKNRFVMILDMMHMYMCSFGRAYRAKPFFG